MTLELLSRFPVFEEIGAKPNLLKMSLVFVSGEDLLHSIRCFGFDVIPKPDQGEASSPNQFELFESVGEPTVIILKFFINKPVFIRSERIAGLLLSDVWLFSLLYFCFKGYAVLLLFGAILLQRVIVQMIDGSVLARIAISLLSQPSRCGSYGVKIR